MVAEPDDIINIGNRLLDQHPETFSTQFEENKHLVKQFTDVGSFRLRNRIAGYITRQQANN